MNKVTLSYDTTRHLLDEVYCNFYECPKCGDFEIRRSFKYCPICGSKVEWEDEKQQSE